MNDLPEPLESFLQGDFEQPADAAMRNAILQKTNRVLWRGRWFHRLCLAAALAACFVAGIIVGGFGLAKHSIERVDVQAASPSPPSSNAEPAMIQEWKAFDAQENRAEFYLAAGRKYLRDSSDYASALRCYRRALDLATEEELTVSPDDDWLLTTLKKARQKENFDASSD